MIGLIYLLFIIPLFILGLLGWKALLKKEELCVGVFQKSVFIIVAIILSSISYALAASIFANSSQHALIIGLIIGLLSALLLFVIWVIASITVYMRAKQPSKVASCFVQSVLAAISLVPICMSVYTELILNYLNIQTTY
ncbi:MAG: hypothetical protein KZQ73_02945 [Candidatus Thiodiazotropha sp. (ex Semelilucina semeliformis)]|nr:hypothetical protein [Candidatus Thiodiazotropha sp. (ex Semelilucina semeliformis)]